jgi:hypothetical protein
VAGGEFLLIARKGMKSGKVPGRPDSRDWYRKQALAVQQVNANRLMMDPNQKDRQEILPGKMYCFFYDPKHKATLPYYDRFPLVFPLKMDGDGMLGINLHYLPHDMRAMLMDALYQLEDKRYRKDKKLRLSYEILNGAARFRYFKPCIKKYLFSHLRSRFLEIPYGDWDVALMMPLERFEKQKKQTVWKESRQKVSK